MSVGVIPEGLAAMLPGPDLAAALASVELGSVPDVELLELLAAEYRQLSAQQARVWAVLAELAGRSVAGAWRPEQVFDLTVDEIRAELRLTRAQATRELAAAVEVGALPRVADALSAGVLDPRRAQVLAEVCADLTSAQADELLDQVLPDAPALSWTGVRDRARRAALAIDPEWAERRYRTAVRERRVIGYLAEDGSATIAARGLSATDAAAACARVDALAAAAKRAGAAAKLDHLRADVFTGLLDGRFHEMHRDHIIATLLAQYPPIGDGNDADGGRANAQNAEPPTIHNDSDAHTETNDAQKANDGADEHSEENATPSVSHDADRQVTRAVPGAQAEPNEPITPRALVGVHVRVRLSTLLGLDDLPGEIAGLGVVPATVAREVVARQQHGNEWRYGILDQDGRLLFDGLTRHRPTGLPTEIVARGGIVELHVTTDLLTEQVRVAYPGWAALLADLAAQYETRQRAAQDPAARFAGRPLRRHVQTLTPHCVGPGCRHASSSTDLDHRRRHVDDGATHEANLEPLCRHDHVNKDERGWKLRKIDDATYEWTSPLGRKQRVQVPPVAPPLPQPIPRDLPPDYDTGWDTDWEPEPGPTFQPTDQHGRPIPEPRRDRRSRRDRGAATATRAATILIVGRRPGAPRVQLSPASSAAVSTIRTGGVTKLCRSSRNRCRSAAMSITSTSE